MATTIDKIRKLLNLAGNEGAAPNEADTARRLAESLMAAAGLSDADVVEQAEDPLATFGVTPHETPNSGWRGFLAMAVSRIVGCYVHWQTDVRGNTGLRWVGTAAQAIARYEKENNLKARSGTYRTSAFSAFAAGVHDGRSVRLQHDVGGMTTKRLGSGS
ncbi:MAG: DUF2786 domain-containing protein [Kofleriaceae bacterium]